jgi:hypothetical protein
MTLVRIGGEGTLSAIVWPAYAGATRDNGDEPLFSPYYRRGQITWEYVDGKVEGHAKILVPRGRWSWIVYCHSQSSPGHITAQRLLVPFEFVIANGIEVLRITEEDIKPLAPDPILHD